MTDGAILQVTESDIINGYRYHLSLKEGKLRTLTIFINGSWTLKKVLGKSEGNNYISNQNLGRTKNNLRAPIAWSWKVRDNVGNYSVSMHAERLTAKYFCNTETAPEDYISDLYQEITDLPNGTYAMTAWVKSSALRQNVYVMYTHKAVTKRKHIR